MAQKEGIHFARYENSYRLQRFLELMLDGQKHTTLDIIHATDICAVNSAACELRENGFHLECIQKTRPAIYQLLDVEEAKILSDRLLSRQVVANG